MLPPIGPVNRYITVPLIDAKFKLSDGHCRRGGCGKLTENIINIESEPKLMLWIRENSLFFSKLLISEAKTKVVDWEDQPIPLKTLDIRVPEPNLKFGSGILFHS